MPLNPGANVALTKEIPDLRAVVLGVQLDARADDVLRRSLVVATMLCDTSHKVISDKHFVFFNQLVSIDGSVEQLTALLGDDDEQIEVDLHAVPPTIDRIVVAAYINDPVTARRTLGQLRVCVIRVLDLADNRELTRSVDLASSLGDTTAAILGELYRHGTGWKFKVIGQGVREGIAEIARLYGLPT